MYLVVYRQILRATRDFRKVHKEHKFSLYVFFKNIFYNFYFSTSSKVVYLVYRYPQTLDSIAFERFTTSCVPVVYRQILRATRDFRKVHKEHKFSLYVFFKNIFYNFYFSTSSKVVYLVYRYPQTLDSIAFERFTTSCVPVVYLVYRLFLKN